MRCWWAPLLGALLVTGCAPEIGDSCGTAADCSVSGDRVCDETQPGGYCTVELCDPDACPDNAVCVEWRYDPPRTAETWCMKRCSSDSGCRSAYRCVGPVVIGADHQAVARVIDIEGRSQFCAAVDPGDPSRTPTPFPPGPGERPDAGAMDASMPDAASTDAASPPDGGDGTDAATDAAGPADGAPDA
ncbi:MAG: hypothetical protein ACODAU_04720 [Myxococcota bacterium]